MTTLTIPPGLNLYYLDAGHDGQPAVLLLHGLGSNNTGWQLQVPALVSAGYRVLAPDLRGHGKTPYATGSMAVSRLAADVLALLQSLETGAVQVVGISMGGTVALQLALDQPHLVQRLVLVNTFARLRPLRPSGWLPFIVRLCLVYTVGLSSQAQAVARRVFPHPDQEPLRQALCEQIMQADPRAYRAAVLALSRFNVETRLGEIRTPTLIVTGEADATVAPLNQRRLLAIPGSRQVVIPGAGHGVVADHPAEFNAVLLDFLREG